MRSMRSTAASIAADEAASNTVASKGLPMPRARSCRSCSRPSVQASTAHQRASLRCRYMSRPPSSIEVPIRRMQGSPPSVRACASTAVIIQTPRGRAVRSTSSITASMRAMRSASIAWPLWPRYRSTSARSHVRRSSPARENRWGSKSAVGRDAALIGRPGPGAGRSSPRSPHRRGSWCRRAGRRRRAPQGPRAGGRRTRCPPRAGSRHRPRSGRAA